MTIDELKNANSKLHDAISNALECYYDEVGLTPDVYVDWIDVSTYESAKYIPRVDIVAKIK